MDRIAILRWFGAGAVGLGLVAGCSHQRSTTPAAGTSVACADCGCASGSNGTMMAGTAPAGRAVPMYTSANSVPAPSYNTMPTPKIDPSIVQAAVREETRSAGPALPEPGVKSPFTRGEPAPSRKSFTDITSASCFTHSPDYATICGRVELRKATNSWRLRYLSVDESDDYGGSMTLTGDSTQMASLKDGQYIKVQGHLNDPEKKGTAPFYRVETIEALDGR